MVLRGIGVSLGGAESHQANGLEWSFLRFDPEQGGSDHNSGEKEQQPWQFKVHLVLRVA